MALLRSYTGILHADNYKDFALPELFVVAYIPIPIAIGKKPRVRTHVQSPEDVWNRVPSPALAVDRGSKRRGLDLHG